VDYAPVLRIDRSEGTIAVYTEVLLQDTVGSCRDNLVILPVSELDAAVPSELRSDSADLTHDHVVLEGSRRGERSLSNGA
jgi:hypothetical protein